MTETVRTSANKQLKQMEEKRDKMAPGAPLTMATGPEARDALRATKGNLWQAIKQVRLNWIY